MILQRKRKVNKMATLNNSLAKKPEAKKMEVLFEANGKEVRLTPAIVKNYMVSGNKDLVTEQEVAMFMNLCKFSGLNPWLKEAYCIKYSTNEPATLVVGKEAFMKRAETNPSYDGAEAGIIVVDDMTGELSYRKGTLKLPAEVIIGGYAEVWRKDRTHSTRVEVSFDEYAGRKKDGQLNSQWSKKPATMIRKVALVQALREAFPVSFGGMYTAEEQGEIEADMTIIEDEVKEVPVEKIEAEAVEIIEPEDEFNTVAQALFSGK